MRLGFSRPWLTLPAARQSRGSPESSRLCRPLSCGRTLLRLKPSAPSKQPQTQCQPQRPWMALLAAMPGTEVRVMWSPWRLPRLLLSGSFPHQRCRSSTLLPAVLRRCTRRRTLQRGSRATLPLLVHSPAAHPMSPPTQNPRLAGKPAWPQQHRAHLPVKYAAGSMPPQATRLLSRARSRGYVHADLRRRKPRLPRARCPPHAWHREARQCSRRPIQ
mmetsp:Transcript_8327/g.27484  ORF Transcript_8327/g.27484 Transcript_8327/m.27484 type:complete len:217 (+) Transcript_8327:1300-1950(+)